MTDQDRKDIQAAVQEACKKMDEAYRLILTGKYITDSLETKRCLNDVLKSMTYVEEKAIGLLMELER